MQEKSKQNKGIIFVLLGLFFIVAVFLTIFLPLQNATVQKTAEIASINSQTSMLERHSASLDRYESTIAENKEYINKTLENYPSKVNQEDIIMWLVNFENATGAQIDTLNFAQHQELLNFNAYVNTAQGEQKTTMSAGSISASFSGTYEYSQLKNSLDIIYSSSNKTSVNSVNISYNVNAQQLTVNYNILKYYISYPEAPNEDTPIYDVQTGIDNPFSG